MPLFKIAASKHEPRRGIHYVMRKDKALTVSTINLFGETEDEYVKQFQDIVDYYHKDNGPDARKYYHCKLSPDPKDNISPESLMDFARDMAEKYFSGFQCVIAIHKDTKTLHAHIIVNATGLKGKKVQIMKGDYAPMKDMANEIGENYGLTPLVFKKKPLKKISSGEWQQNERFGTSPKMQIRDAVDHAKELAYTESDFIALVEERNIQVKRVGKDYSFQHPKMKKAVRGATLGAMYTRDYITDFISKKNSNAAVENTPSPVAENATTLTVESPSETFVVDSLNYYDDIAIGDDYVLDEDIDTLFEKDMKKGNLHYGAGYDELYDHYKEFLEDYRKQPDYIPDCLTTTGISQSYIEQGKVHEAFDLYLDQNFNYQNRLISERQAKQQEEYQKSVYEIRRESERRIREVFAQTEEMRKEIQEKNAELDRKHEEFLKSLEKNSNPYNKDIDNKDQGDLESIFGESEKRDVPEKDPVKKLAPKYDDYDCKVKYKSR